MPPAGSLRKMNTSNSLCTFQVKSLTSGEIVEHPRRVAWSVEPLVYVHATNGCMPRYEWMTDENGPALR
jgi:hypothetical protein